MEVRRYTSNQGNRACKGPRLKQGSPVWAELERGVGHEIGGTEGVRPQRPRDLGRSLFSYCSGDGTDRLPIVSRPASMCIVLGTFPVAGDLALGRPGQPKGHTRE